MCGTCEYVVDSMKAALADPATDDKVEAAALAACEQLPAQLAPGCKQYVEQYGEQHGGVTGP